MYHGVELEEYKYNANPDGKYLVFLGRLCRIKGVHTAIDAAKAVNQQLKIAGTVASSGADLEYFKNEVEPRIDGKQIQYIGPVDDRQKSELLAQASALLFPIEWEEPFGLVMIEAMACGTPVIAFRRGAVPEIVTDGING
ncbi:MAG TPA: glycosyl transferase, partial [Candidatus Omnitrophica bacterium]|nr:glycosyl transferase [Candidatus Omnitrophota bacterium]